MGHPNQQPRLVLDVRTTPARLRHADEADNSTSSALGSYTNVRFPERLSGGTLRAGSRRGVKAAAPVVPTPTSTDAPIPDWAIRLKLGWLITFSRWLDAPFRGSWAEPY